MGKPLVWCNGRLFLFLLSIPSVLGWGIDGHYTVCKIAEAYLSKDALSTVKELLPKSAKGDLASVCSWADEVKRPPGPYAWSYALHFANTPDLASNYEYSRDCRHFVTREKHICVTRAISNYAEQLRVRDSNYNLTEALMFLSHFVGDAHQPLHLGYIGDRGGNDIKLRWFDVETNLHKVWDDKIIDSAKEQFYGSKLSTMIEAIKENMKGDWSNNIEMWKKTTDTEWYASESISLAYNFAYKDAPAGANLKDEYFLSRRPLVEKRLAQGGLRLAAILNSTFVPQTRIAQA